MGRSREDGDAGVGGGGGTMMGGGRGPVPAKQLEQREPTITIIYHEKKQRGNRTD